MNPTLWVIFSGSGPQLGGRRMPWFNKNSFPPILEEVRTMVSQTRAEKLAELDAKLKAEAERRKAAKPKFTKEQLDAIYPGGIADVLIKSGRR